MLVLSSNSCMLDVICVKILNSNKNVVLQGILKSLYALLLVYWLLKGLWTSYSSTPHTATYKKEITSSIWEGDLCISPDSLYTSSNTSSNTFHLKTSLNYKPHAPSLLHIHLAFHLWLVSGLKQPPLKSKHS